MKVKSESEVTQSCPTLSDPMDCSLPGSSVHGICQARVLEWGAIAFSVWSGREVLKIFLMWTIFKIVFELVTILLLFDVLGFFWPGGKWDFGSLTRDQTLTHCIGR